MSDARRLVVGRLRKPHGLKGEFTVFPLTNDPGGVFAPGRELWRLDLSGAVVGDRPVVVERSRAYHREWLVKFRGVERREDQEGWRDLLLAAPADELALPGPGEVYLHELEGFAVRRDDGTALGVVSGVFELPAGVMLEVQGSKREFLLPFRKEFVTEVDRAARRLTVVVPEGLLD